MVLMDVPWLALILPFYSSILILYFLVSVFPKNWIFFVLSRPEGSYLISDEQ